MTPDQEKVRWLFLDLNSYFAHAEQQARPELRGHPVAVVPMETDSTCVIAASYEAKAFGIKTGTAIRAAKKLCPRLRCVLARHDLYVRYHHRITEAIEKHVPIDKVWSIDEVACRLMGPQEEPENAIALAHAIKTQMRKDAGAWLTCSIGLAPSRFLAKVAGDMRKPDGLTLLRPCDLPGPLFRLKLDDLPGINVNIERRLRRAGIGSVRDLWNAQPKHLRKLWGGVQGERLWHALHGLDVPDQETRKRMVGHSRVLDPGLRPPDKARETSRHLLAKAAQRLRRMELYAGSVSLGVRDVDGRRWGAEIRIPTACDTPAFLAAHDVLWTAMTGELSPGRLLKDSVTLHRLQDDPRAQPDLFAAPPECSSPSPYPASRAAEASRNRLCEALDTLNRKYGQNTAYFGVVPKTAAGYVGT